MRDFQERFPVFLIGKDFAPSMSIKAGIQSGMNLELYDGQQAEAATIRQYGNQGIAGIIPKVKINWCELATFVSGQQVVTKEECRARIEAMLKRFSDDVRLGRQVDTKIPTVGRLLIKGGVAGVIFDQDTMLQARGKTAKKFNSLFSKNNWMNQQIYQPNRTNYGDQAEWMMTADT